MARRRNKGEEKAIVQRRLQRLVASARAEALGPDADLADRHATIAAKVARRYQRGLPAEGKALICRQCHTFGRTGTLRVRIHRGRLIRTCITCGNVRRRPL